MVKANLNSKGIEKYLGILFPAGLLTQPGVEYYRTSSRGMDFLKRYRMVKSLMGELEILNELSFPSNRPKLDPTILNPSETE
jgi:hypothetical protein